MPRKKKSTIEQTTISRVSEFFITRFRITILLFVGLLTFGILSYTQFLKREGFPVVNVPIIFVQSTYFVNDKALVNDAITNPIEEAIADIDGISAIQSTTTDNVSFISIELEETAPLEDTKDAITQHIASFAGLPESSTPTVSTFKASSIDGKNDLLFFISSEKPLEELLGIATTLSEELTKIPQIATAEVKEQFEDQTNPFTGDTTTVQTSFSRVGVKDNDTLVFKHAVAIGVKKKGTNIGSLELSDAVKEVVQGKSNLLEGVSITYGGDQADDLRAQISSLEENVFTGIMAVIVILFFYLNVRASIVAALFIPTVLSATFVSLYVIGYSLNTIVLFSLILVLGLFVDDAIVVIEAIDYQKRQGTKGLQAVRNAISLIGSADVSGTLTTVLVFVPMLFISGILGDFIRLIPITVILALSISLVVALTLIPLFSYFALLRFDLSHIIGNGVISYVFDIILNGFSYVLHYLSTWVAGFVQWYLRHKIVAFGILVVTFVTIGYGGSFAQKIPFSIFPEPKDSDLIQVSIDFDAGTTIEEAIATAKQIEARLKVSEKHIKEVHYFSANEQSALLQARLTPLDTRTTTAPTIVNNLQTIVDDAEGATVKVTQLSAGPPASDYPFAMQIFGNDLGTLQSASKDIQTFLEGRVIEGDERVIEVVIDDFTAITKKNRTQYAQIRAKLSDPTNTGLVLKLQEIVEAQYTTDRLALLGLPEDALGFDFGQESDNIDSFNGAVFALGASIVVMYALLVVQFNSLTQPLLILFAIPLSFPGLFPGLYLTDNSLGFFVMLGIIGLVGIVVNNSIMLIDFANQARREGKTISDAISAAVQIRFRPIVTTTTTTIAGLLPLAFTDPFWEPLALSIIFGLIASSILVLLFLPAFYAVLEKTRVFVKGYLPNVIE